MGSRAGKRKFLCIDRLFIHGIESHPFRLFVPKLLPLSHSFSSCRSTRQYQSIHIINATDCTITSHLAVSGPVHVTNCHGTTISTACRQLRIHDCTAVTFRVWVKSGPIIEHCSQMVFRGDPVDVRGGGVDDGNGGVCHWDEDANMYHDVKDFCWLRTGVPSPNFTVVQCCDEDAEEDEGGTEEGGGGGGGGDNNAAIALSAGQNNIIDECSSDEDEL